MSELNRRRVLVLIWWVFLTVLKFSQSMPFWRLNWLMQIFKPPHIDINWYHRRKGNIILGKQQTFHLYCLQGHNDFYTKKCTSIHYHFGNSLIRGVVFLSSESLNYTPNPIGIFSHQLYLTKWECSSTTVDSMQFLLSLCLLWNDR